MGMLSMVCPIVQLKRQLCAKAPAMLKGPWANVLPDNL